MEICVWNLAGVPPEVFVQLNAELHSDPWIVEYYMAADPITDFYPQYAAYIKKMPGYGT